MIEFAGGAFSRRALLAMIAVSACGVPAGRLPGSGAAGALAPGGRGRLVVGTYRPGPSTTGVAPGSMLTITHEHVPRSGKTYTNLDVRHTVVPGSDIGNVTYRNCIFRGPMELPSSYSSLYALFRPHQRGFTFIDCTFRPQHPDFRWVGIQGYGFTMQRCDASELVDQVEVFDPNDGPGGVNDDSVRNGPCDVVIEQCYFHDSAYFKPGVDASPDGSHSDGIQWEGGTGLIVRGNYFTGRLERQYAPNFVGGDTTNSALMIKPDAGNLGGGLITGNWLGGGSVTINVADSPTFNRYIEDVGTITDNHFSDDQFYAPTAIVMGVTRVPGHDDIAVNATGNAFAGTGAPVPVVRRFS